MKLKKIALFVVALFLLCFVPVQANDFYDNAYEDGYEDGYENGHEEGYVEGEEDGYEDGYGSGYDKGYDEGYDSGHNSGYDEGYEAGIIKGRNSKASLSDWIAVIFCLAFFIESFRLVVYVVKAIKNKIEDRRYNRSLRSDRK